MRTRALYKKKRVLLTKRRAISTSSLNEQMFDSLAEWANVWLIISGIAMGPIMLLHVNTLSWAGVQEAGTTGLSQTTCGWTKWDFDEQIIGHVMKRPKIFCPNLTNLTFGSLSRDINTLSNKYWTHCPLNIEYLAY